MEQTNVVLVDKKDNKIGLAEKMEAHRKGLLHRAVSIFIINSQGEWLLQQRAMTKYHSRGLWTNAACSHPFDNETNLNAAKRRLIEEMGINAELTEIFSFVYRAELDNNLIEHELDHVFIGFSDNLPKINKDEVMDYKYVDFDKLNEDVKKNPEKYTVWFKLICARVQKYLSQR